MQLLNWAYKALTFPAGLHWQARVSNIVCHLYGRWAAYQRQRWGRS